VLLKNSFYDGLFENARMNGAHNMSNGAYCAVRRSVEFFLQSRHGGADGVFQQPGNGKST